MSKKISKHRHYFKDHIREVSDKLHSGNKSKVGNKGETAKWKDWENWVDVYLGRQLLTVCRP